MLGLVVIAAIMMTVGRPELLAWFGGIVVVINLLRNTTVVYVDE